MGYVLFIIREEICSGCSGSGLYSWIFREEKNSLCRISSRVRRHTYRWMTSMWVIRMWLDIVCYAPAGLKGTYLSFVSVPFNPAWGFSSRWVDKPCMTCAYCTYESHQIKQGLLQNLFHKVESRYLFHILFHAALAELCIPTLVVSEWLTLTATLEFGHNPHIQRPPVMTIAMTNTHKKTNTSSKIQEVLIRMC